MDVRANMGKKKAAPRCSLLKNYMVSLLNHHFAGSALAVGNY